MITKRIYYNDLSQAVLVYFLGIRVYKKVRRLKLDDKFYD